MKARMLNDGEAVNPIYLDAEVKGDIVPTVVIPAGTVIDNPDAWMLCVNGIATPDDDECRAATMKFLGSDRRKALIESIKSLQKADGVQRLDSKTKKWLEYMEKAYAVELAEPAPVV
jgi:hypothetical protein